MKCALIIDRIPTDFFEDACPRGDTASDVLFYTARRPSEFVIPNVRRLWGSRIAWLPGAVEQTKTHLKCRYRDDEARFLSLLRREGSTARDAFYTVRLNRDITKQVFRGLSYNRKLQVAFGTIVCATRFKFFDGNGELRPAHCTICWHKDSLAHLIRWVE